MAHGSPDYWISDVSYLADLLTQVRDALLVGSDMIDAIDALDGTIDGLLTLGELNISAVKTNIDTLLTKTDLVNTKLDSVKGVLDVHSTKLDLVNAKLDNLLFQGGTEQSTSAFSNYIKFYNYIYI